MIVNSLFAQEVVLSSIKLVVGEGHKEELIASAPRHGLKDLQIADLHRGFRIQNICGLMH